MASWTIASGPVVPMFRAMVGISNLCAMAIPADHRVTADRACHLVHEPQPLVHAHPAKFGNIHPRTFESAWVDGQGEAMGWPIFLKRA